MGKGVKLVRRGEAFTTSNEVSLGGGGFRSISNGRALPLLACLFVCLLAAFWGEKF